MVRRLLYQIWALLSVALLLGCPQETAKPDPSGSASTPASTVVAAAPRTLFKDPLPLHRVELAPEALAVWRQYADLKPTLLLLSNSPMLLPVPSELRQDVDRLAGFASGAELFARSFPKSPELLLLPDMTVDTALRLGWLGGLSWIVPVRLSEQALSLESFRRKFLDRKLATQLEAETLTEAEGRIAGTLRGRPFRAAALGQQEGLTGPLLVHIDLSYFQVLYKNDVSTPVLEIVMKTLEELRALKLPVLAITFSYGNLDDRIAVDVRFLGELLAQVTEQPSGLDQPIPVNLARQGEILYLVNFFQKEKIRDLALAQEKALPEAAWVKFNLFRVAADHKDGVLALDYLAKAVALDRVYALEYQSLAAFAHEKGRPDEALRMLKLSSKALPEDPFLRLQLAQLAAELGDRETARQLVAQLRALPWSPVYFADLPQELAGFAESLETAGESAKAKVKGYSPQPRPPAAE